jgi:hypothetical protein
MAEPSVWLWDGVRECPVTRSSDVAMMAELISAIEVTLLG